MAFDLEHIFGAKVGHFSSLISFREPQLVVTKLLVRSSLGKSKEIKQHPLS